MLASVIFSLSQRKDPCAFNDRLCKKCYVPPILLLVSVCLISPSFVTHPFSSSKQKRESWWQTTKPPGFHIVLLCSTTHPGSEQQSASLNSINSPPFWPLLLITLAHTCPHSLLPYCAASSPPPTSRGEASRMGKVRAKCHHLLSTLILWVLHS